jgi:perosamine synthetase
MTMPRDLSRNLLPDSASLRDVLVRLNEGIQGVVFLVDGAGKMTGLFTDGDARRALLGGAPLEAKAAEHTNRKFTAGSAAAPREENLQLLNERIRHLPILDAEGRPVDIITWAELWRLPVMEPSLGGNELKYVSDCIASGWISSQGQYVRRFEEAFARFLGVSHALTVSNGTVALHLALVALGIGPGDEVIVPDLTFAASANVVIHCGAKPVMADVTRETWTLDAADVARKITPRTKAIMPVHLYGHPSEMTPLMELAKRHDLRVVEDCAESLGAEYRGQKTGTFGEVGCFSFFANKVITTGEGGMVTTNDPELAHRMMVYRDHGMEKSRRYWHVVPGYNYRMTNLQAAIGLAQMERIERFLTRRAEIVAHYDARLSRVPGIILPPRAAWAKNIHWLYSIVVDPAVAGLDRDTLSARLAEGGVETRGFFYPLHIQPPYEGAAICPVSAELSARGLSLPTSNDIRFEDVAHVCDCIERIVSNTRAVRAA